MTTEQKPSISADDIRYLADAIGNYQVAAALCAVAEAVEKGWDFNQTKARVEAVIQQ